MLQATLATIQNGDMNQAFEKVCRELDLRIQVDMKEDSIESTPKVKSHASRKSLKNPHLPSLKDDAQMLDLAPEKKDKVLKKLTNKSMMSAFAEKFKERLFDNSKDNKYSYN